VNLGERAVHHHHYQYGSLLLFIRFWTSFLCVSIPLCPQLSIWMQHSQHHLPNHVAAEFFSSSCWFTSPSAFSNLMQKSVMSHGQSVDVSFVKQSSVFACLRLLSSVVTLFCPLSTFTFTFQKLLIFYLSASTSMLHTVLHSITLSVCRLMRVMEGEMFSKSRYDNTFSYFRYERNDRNWTVM